MERRGGANFETCLGIDPPEAIGVLTSNVQGDKDVPVFSGDGIAPDLSRIHFKDVHIWVWAHSVFSKVPILRQARTSELLAVFGIMRESWSLERGVGLRGRRF
jgi:hypothetical protein